MPVPGGQLVFGGAAAGYNQDWEGDGHDYRRQYPHHHQGDQVESYRFDKFERGTVQALLEGYPRSTPQEQLYAVRKKVAEYAQKTYDDTDKLPSPAELSAFATRELGVGVRAQARVIDRRHKVVQTITVKPSEVPESIRAKFESR